MQVPVIVAIKFGLTKSGQTCMYSEPAMRAGSLVRFASSTFSDPPVVVTGVGTGTAGLEKHE
jgi:hypothetical protein